MTRGGREDEAKECFHIFDKKEKSFVSFNDVALVLREYIRSDLSDDEVREFMKEIDPHNNGHISSKDFLKLYLS